MVFQMRLLALIPPFIVPFFFHWLYQPVNASWTVKQFGCGCPPVVAPRSGWQFNANHFNLIIWLLLFAACALSWWIATRGAFRSLTPNRRLILRGFGLYVLLLMCARHWAKEGWL
jgi:hypothetical protein